MLGFITLDLRLRLIAIEVIPRYSASELCQIVPLSNVIIMITRRYPVANHSLALLFYLQDFVFTVTHSYFYDSCSSFT